MVYSAKKIIILFISFHSLTIKFIFADLKIAPLKIGPILAYDKINATYCVPARMAQW